MCLREVFPEDLLYLFSFFLTPLIWSNAFFVDPRGNRFEQFGYSNQAVTSSDNRKTMCYENELNAYTTATDILPIL